MQFIIPYLFIIGFISFDLTLTTSLSLNDDCLTPNNESALCISIYDCESFLQNLSNRTAAVEKFMALSKCGRGDHPNDVLVCCGSVASFTQIITPITPHKQRKISAKFLPSQKECGLSEISARIFGGNETKLDEYPWMALLQYEKSNWFHCGGFLISKRYVLTAAHCVVGSIKYMHGKLISVRLGEHDLRTEIDERKGEGENEPYQDIPVENIVWHKQYFRNRNYATNKQNDIAVVKLSRDVEFSDFIRPICLPLQTERKSQSDILFVAGWGTTEKLNTTSPVKRHVNLTLFDHEKCKEKFKKSQIKITYQQICAGGEKGKDSCTGDSGGPLMKVYIVDKEEHWFAEGIVSFGNRLCGTVGIPGVYVNITAYMDWIIDTIEVLEEQ